MPKAPYIDASIEVFCYGCLGYLPDAIRIPWAQLIETRWGDGYMHWLRRNGAKVGQT